jgi:putative endonuclease
MAGLVPAIPLRQVLSMAEYYVYFLASRPGGAIYIGVTNDLIRRVYEHRTGAVKGHTSRYKIHRLIYFESYGDVRDALQREKNIKHWPRVWKTRLILEKNPDWHDLFEEIASSGALPT